MPRRPDSVHFRIGRDDFAVAFQVALELAERARRAPDEAARSAGAYRPIKLSPEEQAALAEVIDAWAAEGAAVRRLRERLP